MALKIVLTFLLILLVPDLYIYFKFIARLKKNIYLKLLYFLPTLLLLTGLTCAAYLMGQGPENEHMIQIQQFIWLLLLFSVPKCVFFLVHIIGKLFVRKNRFASKILTRTSLLLAFSAFSILIYGGTWGRSNLEIKEITFHSPKLPNSFQGFRIIQISDLHLGSWFGKEMEIDRIVEKINALHPDVILFTGDLVNCRADEAERFLPILSQLHAPYGIYSIMGNHDYGNYYHWKSSLEKTKNLQELQNNQKKIGWTLLNNTHVVLHQKSDSIALIGCENWGEPPFPRYGQLQQAMQNTEHIPFKILMTHNPRHWRAEVVPQTDIPLTLSGHTHAMQLRMGHHSPASFVYPEWGGMYKEGNQSLYVNIGLGVTLLPLRIGACPEITVITLEK